VTFDSVDWKTLLNNSVGGFLVRLTVALQRLHWCSCQLDRLLYRFQTTSDFTRSL